MCIILYYIISYYIILLSLLLYYIYMYTISKYYAKIHPGTDEHRDADRTGAIRWCLGENSGQNGSSCLLAVFM